MKVLSILATGFEDLEAIVTIALLRRAKINVDICSAENKKHIKGRYNINIESEIFIDIVNASKYDALFLPGGIPGVDNLFKEEKVKELVKYFIENNKLIACICAAPSILGKLGYLEGKNFTCFPGFEKKCINGLHQDVSTCVDGNIITAKAAGCVHEFGYEIIRKLKGDKIAEEIMKSIYFNK